MKVRINGINGNDVVNGEGVSVSLFTQGCPHRCYNCFNPDSWDFDGGFEIEYDELIKDIAYKLTANGVHRNLSFLGGEPLVYPNMDLIANIIADIKCYEPKIYLWTGYLLEDLIIHAKDSISMYYILDNVDVLIDGPYEDDKRDITLRLKGSSNQRVFTKEEIHQALAKI